MMTTASRLAASVMMLLVLMGDTGRANPAPNTGSLDHAFPDTRADNNHIHTKKYSRYAHLLNGMVDTLDSTVFDDTVEFLFRQFGEEPPQARSTYDNTLYDRTGYGPGTRYGYMQHKHEDKTCIEIYGKAHSSSLCLDVFAALSVVGVALLLQFLFYVSVSTFCPNILDQLDRSGTANITNIITIDTSNAVTVETQGGDQTQDQQQGQTQDQDQTQDQMQDGMQGQGQSANPTQNQDAAVTQAQRQNQQANNDQQQTGTVNNRRKKRSLGELLDALFLEDAKTDMYSRFLSWDAGITLPALSTATLSYVSICPVLGRYLTG